MERHEAAHLLNIIGGPNGKPNVAEILKAEGMGYSRTMQQIVGEEGCRKIMQEWLARLLDEIASGRLTWNKPSTRQYTPFKRNG